MKSKKEQKTTKQSKNGKKTIAATPAAKTQRSGAEPKRTIKQVVIETIAANTVATNAEMIAAVKAEFPKSAFDVRHAAWYRSQARKGLLTGTPVAIAAMGRKQSKASN
jgi:hypothetical protein